MPEPDFLTATRAFYDTVAEDYAERFRDELASRPVDRALLTAFAELVRGTGNDLVADLGCGPGRMTEHLTTDLGLTAFGVDLSPGMVAVARRMYPGLRFEVGSMLALDLADGDLGGVLAHYSIIHIPPNRLPEVFAEFHRVLAPSGYLMVAFQVGDEPLRLSEPFGHPVSLDFRRLRLERIAELLTQAGLIIQARLVREPLEGSFESTPRGYLIARKPADPRSVAPCRG